MDSIPLADIPNVGTGDDPLSLSRLTTEHAFVLFLFQRDYHCGNCRNQVQAVAEQYHEFTNRGVEVVSVVPEPRERVADWQAEYELPFPLCADPEKELSNAYDQPVRFGVLGRFSDLLGRMPKAVLLDCRDDDPTVVYTHEGTSTWDRPEIGELLAVIDDQLNGAQIN